MHGARGREQKRLGTSGSTHQSEHVIGYKVLGTQLPRGKCRCAKFVENIAPAYQEHKPDHRDHIGTGMHSDYNGTGQSSKDYRGTQGSLLKKRLWSDAFQVNQNEYAHQPGFQDDNRGRLKADDSYQHMVDNLSRIVSKDASSSDFVVILADPVGKAEASLARITARTGSYPDRSVELAMMKKFGLLPSEEEALPPRGVPGFTMDQNDILRNGDCAFHVFYRGLAAIFGDDALDRLSLEDLRRQAVGFLRMDQEIRDVAQINGFYLDWMANPRVYAGEPEIMALAHIWGVRVTVRGRQNGNDYEIVYNANAANGPIELYYNGLNHYSTGFL